MKTYLAVDIGASSGRHILGWLEDEKLKLKEIYRFKNGAEDQNGHLCWDIDRLESEVINGIAACETAPESVAVDTWAVDYVLLGKTENASARRWRTATAARRRCRTSWKNGAVCVAVRKNGHSDAEVQHGVSAGGAEKRNAGCI